MIRYAIADASSGNVVSILSVMDLETLVLNTPDGHHAHPIADQNVIPGKWRWDGSTLVPLPAAEPSLDDQRAAKWEIAKKVREAAEWWGCVSPLGRVDTDPDSQRKVSGAVTMALIAQSAGQPFAVDWTMQDNSTVAHDAAAMIAMGVAVGRHVAACHEVGLAKRAAIDAASDEADLAAVDIEEGWPDAA